ncbi:hypothetical protein ATANTOWER_023508 [Ataeniobius toweri]|uniref:Uncharacterized protein n=1 Tax=Ataeniobius toweri TaxID=208326 RepID=A0ABU7AIJ4_9TELE|nr:hypothetical protein [Ataeniobius toweri]
MEENSSSWTQTSVGFHLRRVSAGSLIGYESPDLLVSNRIPAFKLFQEWPCGGKGNSPASFCRSRYAPPLCRPMRHAGNGGENFASSAFYSSDDISFDVHRCGES